MDNDNLLIAAHLAAPTAETRRRLIEAFVPYAKAIGRRIAAKLRRGEREDVIADAMFGLIVAVDALKPDRGNYPHTFIGKKIRWHVYGEIRDRSFVHRAAAAKGWIGPEFIGGDRVEALTADQPTLLDDLGNREALGRVMGNFAPADRLSLLLRIGCGLTQQQIGRCVHDVTKERQTQLFKDLMPRFERAAAIVAKQCSEAA